MYNQLKWSPLDERRRRAHLTTFFKFHRGEVVMNNTRKPVPSPPTRQHAQLTKRPICLLPAWGTQYRQKSSSSFFSMDHCWVERPPIGGNSINHGGGLQKPDLPPVPPTPPPPTPLPPLPSSPHPPSDCHTCSPLPQDTRCQELACRTPYS